MFHNKINSDFMAKISKGYVLHAPHFTIVNIVASADLEIDLDLYGIAKASQDIDYEPEQFPGAICKIHDPKTALLLFKNGKIICTGAKNREDIRKAIDKVVKIVKNYTIIYSQAK
jgi:transcription initiation factor TFIID TATA-box-binding protein